MAVNQWGPITFVLLIAACYAANYHPLCWLLWPVMLLIDIHYADCYGGYADHCQPSFWFVMACYVAHCLPLCWLLWPVMLLLYPQTKVGVPMHLSSLGCHHHHCSQDFLCAYYSPGFIFKFRSYVPCSKVLMPVGFGLSTSQYLATMGPNAFSCEHSRDQSFQLISSYSHQICAGQGLDTN